MEDTIRCEQCGGSSPADGRFCIECGAELRRAATGPTVLLERPAAPPPLIVPAPVLPPPQPFPRPLPRRAPAADLTAPLAIIGVALAVLLTPRFGPLVLVAIGVGGLILRGMLTRPDRVLPLAVMGLFLAMLFTGGKLFWPLLIAFFVLRAVLGGGRWRC